MLKQKLENRNLILASGSPRRQKFFTDLDLDFEIRLKEIEENYPISLIHSEITDYLAELKSIPFLEELKTEDLLVTSDTIVWHNNKALGKPKNEQDAFNIIKSLSGDTHEVITSVCFRSTTFKKIVNAITKVTITTLTDEEIWHYIKNYKPMDKAGAYGIQEWIGLVGVKKIEGSHFNVMGLPTHLVYKTLNTIANDF